MQNHTMRMATAVAAATLTLVLLSLFTLPRDAAQAAAQPIPMAQADTEAPFSISSSLVLTAENREVIVMGDGVCGVAGQMFELRVRVAQGSTNAFAEAHSLHVCEAGTRQTWQLEAEATNGVTFAEGPAMVCAEVVGYARQGIADEVRWCQEVELIGPEAVASAANFRRNCPSPLGIGRDCVPIDEPPIPTPDRPLPPTSTPDPAREPDVPTNVTVDDVDARSIDVRWEDSSTIETGFTLWFRRDGEEWDTVRAWYHDGEVGTSTGEEYHYTHRDLASNTEYCYRVSAWNEHGGGFSDTRCAQTAADPPDAAELAIRFVQHDSVGLDMTVPSLATFVTIYEREQSSQDWAYNDGFPISVDDPPRRIWNRAAGGLEPDTDYCLLVVLSNNGAEGPPSNEVCVKTIGPPPDAPPYFSAIEVTDSSVTLEWLDISDREERYTLQRYARLGTDNAEFDFGPQDGRAVFTDTGLEPDSPYAYWLWVYSDDNRAVAENIVEVRTEPGDGGEGAAELAFQGSLNLTPTFPDAFEAFTITWSVCNVGEAATGSFTDVARLDENTSTERSIEAQAPGECYEESAQHPGLPPGDHEWVVVLDANNDVEEIQESNNSNRYGFMIPD